jgi:predicted transcriptional regulator
MAAKRDKLNIILDILRTCVDGASKTNIVYQANLNFRTVTNYLDLLVDKGMIEVRQDSNVMYMTTKRGLSVMKDLKSIREDLEVRSAPRVR